MTPSPSLHGYLVLDKPAGWTSFDVVAKARRILRRAIPVSRSISIGSAASA